MVSFTLADGGDKHCQSPARLQLVFFMLVFRILHVAAAAHKLGTNPSGLCLYTGPNKASGAMLLDSEKETSTRCWNCSKARKQRNKHEHRKLENLGACNGLAQLSDDLLPTALCKERKVDGVLEEALAQVTGGCNS